MNAAWLERCSKDNLQTLLRLQKRAAKIILDAGPKCPSVPALFNKLSWIQFYEEGKVAKCALRPVVLLRANPSLIYPGM